MKEKKKQLIVIAFTFALLLLIGGTYAYFSINATSDKTGAKVTGKANNLGNPTMQIKTSKLYLNLDANLMSQANAGKTYYANENENGLALETNPNYTLATAQLPEGDEALDCTYNYKITATVTNPITDNSDSDVKVVVGDKTMTLKELTTAGTNGIIVSGEIKNLTKENSVSIPLTSSVTNTATTQDKLVGNSYTIKIEPYTSGDTKAFSCKLHEPGPVLAQYLIDSGNLWQSGFEGDGYRYTGTNPNNFVCFGTTDKSDCIANQDKYMYRVIGVFSDSNKKNHVKLIKHSFLSDHLAYTSVKSKIINGPEDFKDLIVDEIFDNINESYFLTNANYNYFSNDLWISKIQTNLNQKCSTYTQTNGFTVDNLYDNYSSEYIYNYERFHCTKSGYTVTLMNLSDFILADGSDALNYKTTNNTVINNDSWISSWNEPEWTNAKMGARLVNQVNSVYTPAAYSVGGNKLYINSSYAIAVRPVFSLINEVKFSNGTGTADNPFILE